MSGKQFPFFLRIFAAQNERTMDKNSPLGGHLAVAAAYTIFGLNIVFCKDIATSHVIDPMALFTLRALGASALMWILSLFVPHERVPAKDMARIAAASIIGLFIPQVTFLYAITISTPVDTSVMGSLSPVFTMFFAFFFLGEPLSARKMGGVALSFAGILLLIFNSVRAEGAVDRTSPLGFLLLLLNSVSFALYLGAFRTLISRYSVVTFMKWSFLVSLVVSLPFSSGKLLATDFSAFPSDVLWEIGYLILFATCFAYFLIPYGQKRIRPTLVSLYSYLQPIIAAVVSIWIGQDVFTWQKLLAMVLVFTGVGLVSSSRKAASAS